MGLDSVELLLAIEERFQIHIDDDEASSIATVGELHELLVRKLQPQPAARCLTSVAFYRTRRALVETLNLDRRAIAPSTPLTPLFPHSTRRQSWQRLQQSLALRLPALRLPTAPLVLAIAAFLYFQLALHWAPLLFVFALFAGAALLRAFPNLATEFPSNIATAGDLAREVLAANYATLSQNAGGHTPNELWDALCRTIVDETGVPRERITPEARIVDDLGID